MQVSDDFGLLELMLEDTRNASPLYRPTNYWTSFQKVHIREARRGLHNFRRRQGTPISIYSSEPTIKADINLSRNRYLSNCFTNRLRGSTRLLKSLDRLLNLLLPIEIAGVELDGPNDLRLLYFEKAAEKGEALGAKPLNMLDMSDAGNPEMFHVEGKRYTLKMLGFYLRYAYCCQHIKFDSVESIVELGSGSGLQVEIIKKLHPDTCFYLFDIPPTLYVCERYLTTVFPESVVSYRQTRTMETLPEPQKGKIFLLGTWQAPIWNQTKVDLFWAAGCLTETEPEVAANYLSYVNRNATAAYLYEDFDIPVASSSARTGVINRTTLEEYKNTLGNLQLVDFSPGLLPHGVQENMRNCFWVRR